MILNDLLDMMTSTSIILVTTCGGNFEGTVKRLNELMIYDDAPLADWQMRKIITIDHDPSINHNMHISLAGGKFTDPFVEYR